MGKGHAEGEGRVVSGKAVGLESVVEGSHSTRAEIKLISIPKALVDRSHCHIRIHFKGPLPRVNIDFAP